MNITNRDKFCLILLGGMQGILNAAIILLTYVTLLNVAVYFWGKSEEVKNITLAAFFVLGCTIISSLIFFFANNKFLKKFFEVEHCWNSKIRERAGLIPQLIILIFLIISMLRVLTY